MNFRCPELLALARDQPCSNCGRNDGTTVAAHSNWHDKGAGMKASDQFSCWLCFVCHRFLDQGGSGLDPTGRYHATRDDKKRMFLAAMEKTLSELWEQGLVGVIKR